jgi:hypothetical protein
MALLDRLEDGTHPRPLDLMQVILAGEVEFLLFRELGVEVDLLSQGGTPKFPHPTYDVVIRGECLRLQLIHPLLHGKTWQFAEGKFLLLAIFLGIISGFVRQKVSGVVVSMTRKNQSG